MHIKGIKFSLTEAEKNSFSYLSMIYSPAVNDRMRKRMLVLQFLDQGISISETSKQLKVSERTIYNWVHRFIEDRSLPVMDRLKDKPRSGRPLKEMTEEEIQRARRFFSRHPEFAEGIKTIKTPRNQGEE